jgi:ATP-dependent Lon protease
MPRDKNSKKDKMNNDKKVYKKHQSSDDDESENDEKFDMDEYRDVLAKLFPSKYSKGRTRLKNPQHKSRSNTKHNKLSKEKTKKSKRKKRHVSESDEEDEEVNYKEDSENEDSDYESDEFEGDSEDYDSEDDDIDEEDIDDDELEELLSDAKGSNFNIIFTVGGGDKHLDELDDELDESDDCTSTEDDDSEESEEDYKMKKKHKSKASRRHDTSEKDEEDDEDNDSDKLSSNAITNDVAITKIKSMIKSLSDEEKENPIIKQLIKDFKKQDKKEKKKEEKKTKGIRKKNTITFQKMLREKNVMNDVKYFKDKIPVEKQQMIIDEIINIKNHCEVSKPYRLTLVEADIPVTYKACAYRKINTLKYMEPGSGEYYKIKNWVDTFMQIPFGKFKNLPLTIEDGVDKCHDFMDNAKQILDKAVYGLDDAKLQIMQFVGQWIANPNAIGSAIAIKGPMGTGKTTLVKEGISKILGRDFAFLALGGATDSSFLEGHSYTYEGSTWGKMLDIIIQSKTMNPVIYFDELDKLSDTPKGEEIAGILTHLTDTSQNSKFHDKYFSEVDFDLSRCLFIFSYNDESKVNPILLDRMYRIQTKGYDKKEKTTIAYKYLLPKIREQVKFTEEDITIPEETLHHIIDDHTDKEDGVRNLKRCLEIIYTKLNLYRLMKPGSNLFEKDMSLKVEFPATITVDMISKILKKNKENGSFHHMYM